MREPTFQLTVDEAMAEFRAVVREELGDRPAGLSTSTRTPEEAEENRFHLAEYILSLACPDPRACAEQRCRRHRLCLHVERVRAKRASGQSRHPRRTPGIEAARYAIWVYMNSGR